MTVTNALPTVALSVRRVTVTLSTTGFVPPTPPAGGPLLTSTSLVTSLTLRTQG